MPDASHLPTDKQSIALTLAQIADQRRAMHSQRATMLDRLAADPLAVAREVAALAAKLQTLDDVERALKDAEIVVDGNARAAARKAAAIRAADDLGRAIDTPRQRIDTAREIDQAFAQLRALATRYASECRAGDGYTHAALRTLCEACDVRADNHLALILPRSRGQSRDFVVEIAGQLRALLAAFGAVEVVHPTIEIDEGATRRDGSIERAARMEAEWIAGYLDRFTPAKIGE